MENQWLEVTYLVVSFTELRGVEAGGSGSKRIWMSDLVEWLERNPGTMIVSIRVI